MDPAVESRFRTARVIHAAIVVSLVIYVVLIHVLAGVRDWKGTAATPAVAGVMRWVFYSLGAAEFLGVLVARSRLLSSDALVEIGRRSGRDPALRELQSRMVILLAIAESIAVYGLILFVLTARLADFYLLWVPALVAVLALTPQREVWTEIGRRGPG
jgi:F0F1-type ATP synthase membrane subunit c/vacuolar-type H+-ATPase subunit K